MAPSMPPLTVRQARHPRRCPSPGCLQSAGPSTTFCTRHQPQVWPALRTAPRRTQIWLKIRVRATAAYEAHALTSARHGERSIRPELGACLGGRVASHEHEQTAVRVGARNPAARCGGGAVAATRKSVTQVCSQRARPARPVSHEGDRAHFRFRWGKCSNTVTPAKVASL